MRIEQDGYAVNGAIYYEMAGEGKTIILIHAAIANLTMWDSQWQRFAQHYHVLRYDMRGFGRSEDLTVSTTHRQDLVRLMEDLGVEQAHLIGCSLGGEIALDVALQYPELVKSLVLVSATPDGFEIQGEPPQAVHAMIAALQRGDMEGAARAQNEMSVTGINRSPDAVPIVIREQIYEMTHAAFVRGSGFAESGETLIPPAVERFDEVKAPTLLMVGTADHSEIRRAAEMMASGIPNAQKEVVAVENAAHFPNIEQPTYFNEVVLGFLGAL
jgi:2-hydroxy-6-oxonona-2,4-dienedioate hydrolase